MDHAVEHTQKFLGVERLGQERTCPACHGFPLKFLTHHAAHGDDGQLGIVFVKQRDQLPPIREGHHDVGHDGADAVVVSFVKMDRFRSVSARQGFIPGAAKHILGHP